MLQTPQTEKKFSAAWPNASLQQNSQHNILEHFYSTNIHPTKAPKLSFAFVH